MVLERRRWRSSVAALAIAVVVVAGCGSSSTSPSAATTAPPTTASAGGSPAGGSGQQTVTVTPSTGLTSGQRVQVQATGFTAGQTLIVLECANKGAATGEGDCDLTDSQSATPGPNGQATATLRVTKGPFGSDKIVCGTPQSCIVSVNPATPDPTQQASASIAFGS